MRRYANIGVCIDGFSMDTKRALDCAGTLGFAAAEVSADNRETSPLVLSSSGRRHLARLVRHHGMNFCSLGTSSFGSSLAHPAKIDRIVHDSEGVLRLAADMAVPLVSHDVGDLLALDEVARGHAAGALRTLAERADSVGVVYAIRSSRCAPQDLRQLVDAVDCSLVRISVDPGALLASGTDPLHAVSLYGTQVALGYVRDALRGRPDCAGTETALGRGELDLEGYLALLESTGCTTPKLLRRERVSDPRADLASDLDYLQARLP